MPLLAAAFVTASIAGLPRTCADAPTPASAAESADDSAACTQRYNALLGQAKASLMQGDRNAAINLMRFAARPGPPVGSPAGGRSR